MIRTYIKIGSGVAKDSYNEYGMIYVSSDNRFSAPIKGMLEESFADEAGKHTDGKTVDDSFEYKMEFLIECPNKNIINANKKIAAINALMYDKVVGSDIKIFKEWTIFNYRKRAMIVGIPKPIEEAKDFWRDSNGIVHDSVLIELKLQVFHPELCDFDIIIPETVTEQPGNPNLPIS